MNESFICEHCQKSYRTVLRYPLRLEHFDQSHFFCSKLCLLRWIVLSIDSVAIPEPYRFIPPE